MHIEYLNHSDINKLKWDQVIHNAPNGLLYACSWYLDCISPQWDALVYGDYEAIFPITLKRKYHIPYIVQPLFAQQLGMFGSTELNPELLSKFIARLPSYSYEINLNFANFHPDAVSMNNYIVSLINLYDELSTHYSYNTIRNIRKAKRYGYAIVPLLPEEFIKLYSDTEHKDKRLNLPVISNIICKGYKKGYINCVALKNEQGETNAMLAYGLFKKRIHYLFPASTAVGKKHSAMFLLVDLLFQQFAGKLNTFDFEGSMIEGIARFYKGFGAINQPYQTLKHLRPSFLIGKI